MISLALIGALLLVLAAALYDRFTGVPATYRRGLLESRSEWRARMLAIEAEPVPVEPFELRLHEAALLGVTDLGEYRDRRSA